ncbi:MAG: hypothetical protein QM642_11975 [Edaphocola sp.]
MDYIIQSYSNEIAAQRLSYLGINKRYGQLAYGRLAAALAAIFFLYQYFANKAMWLLVAAAVCVVLFVVLLKMHQVAANKRKFAKTLLQIKEAELLFLQEGKIEADNGLRFADAAHAYTSDLDIFGHASLYQYLNRTATYMGAAQLANALKKAAAKEDIVPIQEAVAEQSKHRARRHKLLAMGLLASDREDNYKALMQWSAAPPEPVPQWARMAAWILPLGLLACMAAYGLFGEHPAWGIAQKIIFAQLLVFFATVKHIKSTLFTTDKITAMLAEYGSMLQLVSDETYESDYMKRLQAQVATSKAGEALRQLGKIFKGMETIQNPFGAFVMNGLYLYHIHQWNKLVLWRKRYAGFIPQWLETIGSVERINSLANFAENNPRGCYPSVNENCIVSFENLGHPLIPQAKRVANSISFQHQKFVILTGSNMSGKSTFLRTLGVNMVLACAGAPVMATAATFVPMPVLVSMRQVDSLSDNESYFFAEVKRLRYIVKLAKEQTCFILLDEILRGTNSDDKRSGTIGVILKLVSATVNGVIATHDLEVCATTYAHPEMLSNKCFEVEITNDELHFDYKLREGICQNKSATFLMEKMGII